MKDDHARPTDWLTPEERTHVSSDPRLEEIAHAVGNLGDPAPEPSPAYHDRLRAAAAAAGPTRARRRWLTAAAAAVASAAAVLAAIALRTEGRESATRPTPPPINPEWLRFADAKPPAPPKPEIPMAERPVDRRAVFGDEASLSESQKKFADWVAARKTLAPRVAINGKEYPVGKDVTTPYREDHSGWKYTGGTQFDLVNERVVVAAREVTDTLFSVQDVNAYPGLPFKGGHYLRTGEIVRAVAPRGTFAPVRLTVFGPPLGFDVPATRPEDLRVNLLEAGSGAKALPRFDLALDPEVSNPASRAAYERIHANELLPLVGKSAYFSQETDTARAKEEFELKAGLRVTGGFGTVFAEAKVEEREEHGLVYVRGVEVSHTVAVADRPEAARWVNPGANVDELVKGEDPLMYVSEVVYGRAWIVVATSSLSTSEITAVLNGKFDAFLATLEPDLKLRKKSELASTTLKVFNIGGNPSPEVFSLNTTDYTQVPALIQKLQQPALTPQTARPIAFRARWLADDTPAGWVGVAPMRVYTKATQPVKFDVTLRHYHVRKGFGGFLFFGGGGKLNIGARLDSDPDRGPYPGHFYRKLDEADHRDINHPLLVGRAVPGTDFTLVVRQAELGGGIANWEQYAERVGDGFGEQSMRVNVADVLRQPGAFQEQVLRFPGNKEGPNEVTLRVTIVPPAVPRLPESRPLPGTERKAE